LKYFRRKRKEKLYRQWVKQAGLPPEAARPEPDKSESARPQVDSAEAIRRRADDRIATHPEVTGDMMAEIGKDRLSLRLLYVLFGVALLILCVGLILLIAHTC